MARSYQYGTSPRKIEPNYRPRKKTTQKEKIEKANEEQQRINNLKAEKRRHHKNIAMIVGVFLILLAISYRNSLITEEFKSIQNLKSDLASIEKENKQLEVNIEGSLNLNKIEKIASEQLGMQKQTVEQTIYTELPKEDYVEAGIENDKENDKNFLEKILSIFK